MRIADFMLLNHLFDTTGDDACKQTAVRIREAYNNLLTEGQHMTGDLGGKTTTDQFTQAMIDRVK